MRGGFRVCLHKNGGTWDISRMMDGPGTVWLCECGGVQIREAES